jgi:hypothetical protein
MTAKNKALLAQASKRKAKQNPETALVASCIQLIEARGGVAVRVNSGLTLLTAANGKRRAIHGAKKGTADILACYRGRALAVECKIGKAYLRAEQAAFAHVWMKAGGWHVTARNNLAELALTLGSIDRAAKRD